ncbi:choice-of-anchor D domain-containing protein [Tahibacter harae]|uniref:Choice-of-anchor D domain-containing protein n=1 Tax=Tahibacter harae TaxID=2963937 RepID=A0ABT1QWL1_9GAMM|nr:choice-of-anchor D domain-containing protein [Tahibacter harae]MCQ4166668.1 choice-of-anchor D domain-containing protein [Tahibacter harae]
MHCAIRLLPGILLLSGAAGARADLVPSPGQLDFRYQAVGTTSEPKATTLINTGSQSLNIVAVTPASGVYARAGGTCGAAPFSLAPQASCTIGHTFTPTSAKLFYQTLTVTLSGGSSVNFGLAGEGALGYLEITPPSIWYLPVPVGSSSPELTASLFNNRVVPMHVLQFLPSPVVNAFVRTGGTCPEPPFEVSAFGGCTLAYTFRPTAVGLASMTLDIMGSSGSFVLALAGEGLPELPLFGDGFEAAAPAPVP